MSKVDWSKAPEGAEFFAFGKFRKKSPDGKHQMRYCGEGVWYSGGFTMAECQHFDDYQPRPQQWPETDERIDNIGRNRTEDDMGHYNAPESTESDLINKPKHYQLIGDLEAIDVIQRALTPEQFEGYLIGNFLKYRLRAGKKDDLAQDIAKSEWYRERAEMIATSKK